MVSVKSSAAVMHRSVKVACVASAVAALMACTTVQTAAPPVLKPATGANLAACTALASTLKFDNTRIDSVADVAAGALKLGERSVAAHCLVKGRMAERKGVDGRDYAIGFEMRLPLAWNGRFYYQGNGGLDGAVLPAQGVLGGGPLTGALMQGFAVISSDAGHTGAQTTVFGLEPQARLDYGYQAVEKLTPMAKQLIAQAYGKAPERSYIGGCSNGGRHAMVAATRLGDQYDGYLVGAPGYRLPYAALAQLWGAQQWARVATAGATIKHPMNPNATLADLGTALTAQERQTVANAVLQKCDALDGAADGMVQATQACQAAFSVQNDVKTCAAERNGSCLTQAQKNTLASVFAGGKMANGQAIYSSFPFDPGLAGSNWAQWKFVNALALDPLAIGTVFSVPPGPVDPLTDSVDARLPLFSATNAVYRESGLQLMLPVGQDNPTNLAPLRARGAKMVLYHGVSDPIFSAEDTRQWMERLGKAGGNPSNDFARYFPVPGMNHCSGGPAADQMDLLTPLVQWVEQGVAPQAVVASVRGAGNAGGVNAELPQDWAPTRSRPLCAAPTVATYSGSGSVEDAKNFVCK
ncbi:MAG: hypothetical protein RL682_199 [Pseudomonadota bacterium]